MSGATYRPDIDGLRAVAVLAVLGFHAFPGKVQAGYLGVDVFFVISGYLITALLLRERARGRIDFAAFYARRVRRLFPALLVVLAATLGVGAWLLLTTEFDRLARHTLASLAFIQNLNLAGETGYFDTEARTKPLLHLWSLAVEEQFYIVWPALIALAAGSRTRTGIAITAILALSFGFAVGGVASPELTFFSSLARAWELAAGAMLAWSAPHDPAGRWRDTAAAVALAILLATLIVPLGMTPSPGWMTLPAVTATAALIALGGETWVARRVLGSRLVVGVGLISYPLYLWHWPLLVFPHIVIGETPPPALRIGALAIAFVLAWATWRWVERPLRFTLPRGPALAVLIGGAVAMTLAAWVAPTIVARTRGAQAVMIDSQLVGPRWRFARNDLCAATYDPGFEYFCYQNRPGDPEILLLGNSYANHFYAGFVGHPATRDRTILSYGTCEPSGVYPGATHDCARQDALIARLPSIRTVVVGAPWSFDAPGLDVARYREALTRRLRGIAARGIRVIVIGPKPELGYDIGLCFPRPLRAKARDCIIPRATAEASLAPARAMLRAIVARVPGAAYFDQVPIFCDATLCRFRTAAGYPLLRDNGHYSEIGSRIAVARLIARLPLLSVNPTPSNAP